MEKVPPFPPFFFFFRGREKENFLPPSFLAPPVFAYFFCHRRRAISACLHGSVVAEELGRLEKKEGGERKGKHILLPFLLWQNECSKIKKVGRLGFAEYIQFISVLESHNFFPRTCHFVSLRESFSGAIPIYMCVLCPGEFLPRCKWSFFGFAS